MPSQRTISRRTKKRSDALNINSRPTGSDFVEKTVPGMYPFWSTTTKEILNSPKVSYDELQMMINLDGHARALYNMIKMPILRNTNRAFIKPPLGGEGGPETEFIRSNLLGRRHEGGMTIPFKRVTAHQCLATLFGFKVFEKVPDMPGTVVDDGFIRIRKLAPRDSRTISFITDETGGFDGFRQRTYWQGQYINRLVERRNAVYFAVNEEEKPMYGNSMFMAAYNHFDKKHKMYYVVHLALAIGAMKPRLAKATAAVSFDERQKFLNALSNLGTNSAMLIPQGFEILDSKLVDGAVTGLPYMEILAEHNMEMSKSILAQALDVGTSGGTGGGFSLSKNHFDFLVMALEGLQDDMMDMWNDYVIPDLITWNFPGSLNFPKIVLPPFTSETRDLMADVFKSVTAARTIPWSPEFMAQMEKKMATEIDLEVPDRAIDDQMARRIAADQLEQAVQEASIAISKDAGKTNASQLIADPKFWAWAESYADRILAEQTQLALVSGDGDIE